MALRLENDLALLGKDDVLGQRLMDAELLGSSRSKTATDGHKKKVNKKTADKEQGT